MKKILVALDGSPRAEGVLRYAESIARPAGAKLVLFRSFYVPPELELAWPARDSALEEAMRKETYAYLVEYAGTLPREMLDEVRVGEGEPWRAVCLAAQEASADLIVIGSHGFGGLDHLLGTTAGKIVNHADRLVLVYRPAGAAAP